MRTDRLKTDFPKTDPNTGKNKGLVSARFDASDLHPKYEDFQWTIAFPLEKLCLTEIGLKDILRNGKVVKARTYRDIASVFLPGVTESAVARQHPDWVYVKAAKEKGGQWPLLIPSRPPL